MVKDKRNINTVEAVDASVEKQKEETPIKKRRERLDEVNHELMLFNGKKLQDVESIENQRNREFEKKMQEMKLEEIPINEETQNLIYQNMVDDSIEFAKKENERFKSLINEKKIIEYLDEVLSETEERINVPMDKKCEVCVVIPAYGEREYILRPMETLAEQKDVAPEQFEVIFVINNPGSEPKKKRNETEDDFKRKIEHYKKALKENPETINMIKYINGENVEVFLSEKEKEIVDKIKSSGIRIFILDKASEGKTLDLERANVGGARNRGMAEAVARFYEQKNENGIIAQTDADTRVDHYYIHNIIETFKSRPELVGAAGELKFEQIEKYSTESREASTYAQFEYFYWLLSDVLFNEKVGNKKENILVGGVHFSGANMLSRAYESAIAGGVPEISGGEDPAFGKRLSSIGETDRVADVLVITADRFSPRTDVNAGHGQQKIRFAEAVKNKESIFVIDPNANVFLKELEQKMFKAIIDGNVSLELLRQMMNLNGEALLAENDLNIVINIIGKTGDIQVLKVNEELKVIGEKLRNRIEEILPKIKLEEASENLIEIFLEENPGLREEYKKTKKEKIEKENSIVKKRIAQLIAFIDVIFETDRGRLDEKGFVETVKKNKLKIGIEDVQIEELESDEYILGILVDIVKVAQTKNEALENWKNFFRSDFLLVEDYPLKKDIICLKAMLKIKNMLKEN